MREGGGATERSRTTGGTGGRGRRLEAAAALLIYSAVSVALFGLAVFGRFPRAYIGAGNDPLTFMWFLVWWPHALREGLDPFITNAVWAPGGVNLAWTTSIPGPSLAAAPLTVAFGPVVAFNVLMLMAPPLSAWTAYVLCRHVSGSFVPALIGGYLFGFSTYALGHQIAHMNLALVFAVPLAAYLVLLDFDGVLRPPALVGLLAATLVLQFSISTEIFASSAVFGAMVLALALAGAPAAARGRVRSTCVRVLCAYALAALALLPYLRHVFAAGIPTTPILDPEHYSSDLLNFFLPTPITFVGGQALHSIAKDFRTNLQETTAYMSLPLLAVVWMFGRRHWRSARGRLLVGAFLLTCVASLGPTVHADGVPLAASLWRPFVRLPLINNALPDRFVMYAFLAASLILAVWLASADASRRTKWALASLAVLLLLPDIPSGPWATPLGVPDFFAQGLYRRHLAPGVNAIVVPYSTRGGSMLWQAQSRMYFRMAGGYLSPRVPPEFQAWPVFRSLYTGTAIPSYRTQLLAFLASHDVGAILVDDAYVADPRTRAAWPELLAGLGLPVTRAGGVSLYTVPPAQGPRRTVLEMQQRLALDNAAALVAAARRYLDGGGPPARLTPSRVEPLGLLPAGWVPAAPGLAAQAVDHLWLGPWGTDEIGVGLVGSEAQVEPVIRRYAAYAAGVYFPFPKPWTGGIEDRSGELLMVFTPDGLARAPDLAMMEVSHR